MWLVVGLGNPGRKYQNHRHNVGFFVVDELARRSSADSFREKFGGELSACLIDLDKVQLLKPMEFMNNSGYAVQRASDFFDIDVEKTIVVHDEIDLDVGRVKLKNGGGHGGHNGLRSIIQQVGSRDFLRVRVGVGKPPTQGGDAGARDRRVAGYVLSDIPAAHREAIDDAVRRAADAVEAIIARGMTAAMNEFNSRAEKATEQSAS